MLALTAMKVVASSRPWRSNSSFPTSEPSFRPAMPMRKLLCLLLFLAGSVSAQPSRPPALEPIPDGPPSVAPDKGPAVPEVTIRRVETGIIREFRLGGRLSMIEIIPSVGPSYFLVDTDGDGSLETRYSDLDPRIAIPAWVLLRW